MAAEETKRGFGGRPAKAETRQPKSGKGAGVMVRVTKELREALDAEASRTGRSLSQVAELWLEAGQLLSSRSSDRATLRAALAAWRQIVEALHRLEEEYGEHWRSDPEGARTGRFVLWRLATTWLPAPTVGELGTTETAEEWADLRVELIEHLAQLAQLAGMRSYTRDHLQRALAQQLRELRPADHSPFVADDDLPPMTLVRVIEGHGPAVHPTMRRCAEILERLNELEEVVPLDGLRGDPRAEALLAEVRSSS